MIILKGNSDCIVEKKNAQVLQLKTNSDNLLVDLIRQLGLDINLRLHSAALILTETCDFVLLRRQDSFV